jgi:hypothetical protein
LAPDALVTRRGIHQSSQTARSKRSSETIQHTRPDAFTAV